MTKERDRELTAEALNSARSYIEDLGELASEIRHGRDGCLPEVAQDILRLRDVKVFAQWLLMEVDESGFVADHFNSESREKLDLFRVLLDDLTLPGTSEPL